MEKKKIHIIAGATASGKSAYALTLAKQIGGTIVNADSLQVYEDLPLLTARPSEAEQEGIPHLLYGYLDCYTTGSLMKWLTDVIPVLTATDHPVVVGGTGLYLNALIEGINEIPNVDPIIRDQVRQMDLEEVRSKVQDCAATDPQRLRRALEVQLTTGKPLRFFQSQPKKKYIEADFSVTWIHPPRALLYQRCNDRFLRMVEYGAVDQVKMLYHKNPTGGVIQAIGYKELVRYLNGEISLQQAIDFAAQATRNYAKRQTTWFKHQLKPDKIVDNSLK